MQQEKNATLILLYTTCISQYSKLTCLDECSILQTESGREGWDILCFGAACTLSYNGQLGKSMWPEGTECHQTQL